MNHLFSVENHASTSLTEQEIDPIDISDVSEEEIDEHLLVSGSRSQPSSMKDPLSEDVFDPIKGYIYCPINTQIGKIFVEWNERNSIILNLSVPTPIEIEYSANWATTNMFIINEYLSIYMKNYFYAVYPAYLTLNWTFIDIDSKDLPINLIDFNKIEKFSVSTFIQSI